MSRSKVLETAAAAGALATDVAWIGPGDAEWALVMVSGARVDWLRRGEASRLPCGVAALLIRAINPYGFAWLAT